MIYNIKIYFFIICFVLLTKNVIASEGKIIVKVNNNIITNVDIENYTKYLNLLNPNFAKLDQKNKNEISKKKLIKQTIKEIEIKNNFEKIEIEDPYINKLIKKIYINLGFDTFDKFNFYLKKKEINIKNIKKNLLIETLWNQLIYLKYSSKIKINEKKLRENLKNKKNINKSYSLSEIVFSIEKASDLEKKYDEIDKSIKNNGFENTALNYSISETAKVGGKLGWINENAISKELNGVLSNLKVNEYSKPIKIPSGFLILKLNQLKETDIKIDIEKEFKKTVNIIKNNQLNQFSNIFFEKIKKNIFINEL